ncbi:hypothetical protein CSA80_00865 [Candidatus Saccharibacteria bacterium]|nr:MAG: hypothetical protein CR973_02290 [Candidatus Saccharibacteria bacterium]PID99306.1 MAG: hypothetical protein CSA80_00865 [Candidatus Saccharibacteria bacterium]
MNAAIVFQSIKAHAKSAFFVGLGLSAVALMFAGLYDNMKHQIDTFSNILPDGIEAIIGNLATANTPEGWLSIELFAIFVPIGLSILGVVYGSSLIGREEESGTLELLLAGPTTRMKLVAQKFLALAKLLAIPALLLCLAVYIGTVWFPFSPDMGHVLAACASGWMLGLAFGSITFAAQAITGRRGIATAVGAGLFTALWLLNILSRLLDDWKDYEVFSIFYYFNNPGVLVDGMDWSKFMVLVSVVFVGFVLALFGLRKRDVGV